MAIRDTRIKREVFEIIFYVFLIGLVISLAVFSGFALEGFKESFLSNIVEVSSYLGSYLIYIPLLLIALILVIFPIANLVFIKQGEHPVTQENLSWIKLFTISYIYNPEDGFLWYLFKETGSEKQIRWTRNIIRVLFLSVILFGIFGMFQLFYPQIAISGVPQTAQQVTTTSDIVFGSGIPSIAENGALLFTLFFLLGLNAFLCTILIKDRKIRLLIFFMVAILFIAPLMGYIWTQYHSIVYGNSEAKQISTFIFGFAGTELTIFTGIAIWWLIWHFINNLVLKLLEVVSFKEDIALVFGFVLFIILLTYLFIEYRWYKKKEKGDELIVQ